LIEVNMAVSEVSTNRFDALGLGAEQERGSYGWRARVGFITAGSTIETPVYEFYRMAPDGIAPARWPSTTWST
jgi:hypothetical protein